MSERASLSTSAKAVAWAVGLVFMCGVLAYRFDAWWPQGETDPGDRFASLLQGVGTFAAAAGFVLLARQVGLAGKTLQAQLFDQTAGRMAQLNQMMIEHPTARGALVGSYRGPAAQQVEVLAEATIDYFDTELLRRLQFAELLGRFPDFQPWIVQSLRDQRPLGDFLRKRKDWYSDELWALYLRSGMSEDYKPDLKRLVFVREAPTDLVRPGERREVPVPPMVVLGDILVHVHRNRQRTRAIVVGPPDSGLAAVRGIDCEHDAHLPEGALLREALGTRGGAAEADKYLHQHRVPAWRVLSGDSAWYDRLPEEIRKDPRRPPPRMM